MRQYLSWATRQKCQLLSIREAGVCGRTDLGPVRDGLYSFGGKRSKAVADAQVKVQSGDAQPLVGTLTWMRISRWETVAT